MVIVLKSILCDIDIARSVLFAHSICIVVGQETEFSILINENINTSGSIIEIASCIFKLFTFQILYYLLRNDGIFEQLIPFFATCP
jgi:hypothetical protein